MIIDSDSSHKCCSFPDHCVEVIYATYELTVPNDIPLCLLKCANGSSSIL